MTEKPPLLEIEGLKTFFHVEAGEVRAVDGVTISLHAGENLGIVGESGSGKSVTAYSILRLIPEGQGEIVEGSILWRGGKEPIDLASVPIERLPDIRGADIAMIFQEPMTSLNPVFKCGWQVAESIIKHTGATKEEAWKRGTELLDEVGIPMPERRMQQYPHELSGGMKQRVMIAIALACNPKLLICDEPTTALDVTIQKQILDLILDLQRKRGMAVLFITHDLAVIAEITDRVAVMCPGETLRTLYTGTEMEESPEFERGGHIVEFGSVRQIFKDPQHPYTKGLIACRPTLESRSERLPTIDDFIRAEKAGLTVDATDPDLELDYPGKATKRREDFPGFGEPLVEIRNMRTWFPIRAGVFQRTAGWVKAVDDVDLVVKRGQTVGLVGESGCGKTTLGRTLLRLEEPREGTSIKYEGTEVTELGQRGLREIRGKMQIIFQDPYSSLNPRLSVVEAITEPMKVHRLYDTAEERREQAAALLERVGLTREQLDRYPHEFSGGQRQRICIARTLAVEPEFIVCDESVSALDVSIQAGVINLLLDLQDDLGLTYIFISHDLGVVKYVSDMVAVMCSDRVMLDLYEGAERKELEERDRGGHIVEMKPPDELYENPEHPYTQKLLAAIPRGEVEQT
ncbi:MAG: ABC transporter ATP-binding protein [Planctomycetota bacterium]|jgi:peptide/nickel transport system ATP-binding protein